MNELGWSGTLPVDAGDAFAWLTRPGAQARLLPPWMRIALVAEPSEGVRSGARSTLKVGAGPFSRPMVVEHQVDSAARAVVDRQVSGPFSRWHHRRRVADATAGSTWHEVLDWTLPMGVLGGLGNQWLPHRLERALRYRHAVARDDLAVLAAKPLPPGRRIAISGASGLVGSALASFLRAAGHQVIPMVRRPAAAGQIEWDPSTARLDPMALAEVDAVVHLASANLAGRRWSGWYKKVIWNSRVNGTALLARTLAELPSAPSVLVSASAVGCYGDRDDEVLTEASAPGTGFLADLCRQWEGATRPAESAGIRVVTLRSGMVLSPAGGALAKMLPVFRAGIGGRLGNGRQWASWISIDDAIGAIYWALATEGLFGSVNVTGPEPVTNADFTTILGRVLRRPTLGPPVPRAALRLAFGEMADQTVLASQRAVPRRLLEAGYSFRHASLESALGHVLGRA